MKKFLAVLSFVAVVGMSLSGCATVRELVYGRPNKLSPPPNASLGSTPRDEIIREFGAPDEIDRRIFESFDAEVFYYYDRLDNQGPPVESRFLACEFSKGILTAYSYHDSEVSAQHSFDENERFKLIKEKSTKKDAERLLGWPTGKALLPSTITLPALGMMPGGAPFPLAKIPDSAKEAWLYFSQNLDDYLNKSAQKTLTLFFDVNGTYLGSALMQELVLKPQ